MKVCKSCGVDVSAAKRIRNPDGTYFCAACWSMQAVGIAAGMTGPDTLPLALDFAPRSLEVQPGALDFPDDDPVDEGATEEIHYPCRVCEGLCTAAEVYVEADGETICKTCWGRATGVKTGAELGLPRGSALAPAPAPIARPRRKDELFCERCNAEFLAKQLALSPDGAVLCRKCLKVAAEARREAERKSHRQAEFAGTTSPKPRHSTSGSGKRLAITAGIALLAIGWMIYQLLPPGWLTTQKSSHAPARQATSRPADHRSR